MARVTIEDCVEKVDNRFELVALASQRAKSIASGAAITINRDKDKDTVIALREIAQETISVEDLRNQVIQNFQKPIGVDAEEQEILEQETEPAAGQEKELVEGKAEKLSEEFVEGKITEGDEVAEVIEEESEAGIAQPVNDSQELSFEEDNLDVDD